MPLIPVIAIFSLGLAIGLALQERENAASKKDIESEGRRIRKRKRTAPRRRDEEEGQEEVVEPEHVEPEKDDEPEKESPEVGES